MQFSQNKKKKSHKLENETKDNKHENSLFRRKI